MKGCTLCKYISHIEKRCISTLSLSLSHRSSGKPACLKNCSPFIRGSLHRCSCFGANLKKLPPSLPMTRCFISTVLRETFMFCFAGILSNMPPNNAACLKCWMSRNIRAFSFFLIHPSPPFHSSISIHFHLYTTVFVYLFVLLYSSLSICTSLV